MNTQEVLGVINRILSFDNSIQNDPSNKYSIVAYVFVAAVTFLPSRWLTTIGV
jgi:hypothetical protein